MTKQNETPESQIIEQLKARIEFFEGIVDGSSPKGNSGVSIFSQESIKQGLILLDGSGAIVGMDQTLAVMHGYQPDELIGRQIAELYSVDQLESQAELFDGALNKIDQPRKELWHVRKDGTGFLTFDQFTPFNDGNQQAVKVAVIVTDITIIKASDETLRILNANLMALIENTDDYILFSDREGKPVFFNSNYAKMMKMALGIEMKPGLKPHELLDDEESRREWDEMHRRVLSGEKFSSEYSHKMPNGDVFHFEHFFNPVYKDGAIIGFSEFTRNITERKNAVQQLQKSHDQLELAVEVRTAELKAAYDKLREEERKLAQSKERLDAIISYTPDVSIQSYDADGRVLFWNDASEKIFGYSREEALGKTIDELIFSEEESQVFLEILENLQENGEPFGPYEWSFRKRNGEIGYLYSTTFPITTNDRQDEFICIDVDITERKKIEQALKESEGMFRQLSEQSLMGMGIIQDGLVAYANNKLAEITGYSVQEMLAWQQNEFIEIVHQDYRRLVAEQAKKKQSADPDVITSYDYCITSKSGQEKWIENFSRTVEYRNRPADFVTMMDITERKQAEKDLSRAYLELKDLDEMKDNFIANVSHELRTPLVSIRGYTELLLGRSASATQQRNWLSTIYDSTLRLEETIASLLNISRIQSGKMKYEIGLCSIEKMLSRGIKTLEPKLKRQQLELKLQVEHGLPQVNGDETKIISVILNLLDNAIKFSSPGKTITVKAEREGDTGVKVSIIDRGIGIGEQHISQIFNRFYQVDSSTTRLYGGSGVGLSLVKEIIEAQNGTVGVESEPGKGSVFHFVLPGADTERQPGVKVEGIRPKPTITVEQKPAAAILAIDDDPLMQGLLAELCKFENCRLHYAANARDGLRILNERQDINLVLLDIGLPSVSGIEVCRQIKSDERLKHNRVFMLSAFTSEEDQERARNAGAEGFIKKPFSLDEISALLADCK